MFVRGRLRLAPLGGCVQGGCGAGLPLPTWGSALGLPAKGSSPQRPETPGYGRSRRQGWGSVSPFKFRARYELPREVWASALALLPPAHALCRVLVCLFIIYTQPASKKAPSRFPKLGAAPVSRGLHARGHGPWSTGSGSHTPFSPPQRAPRLPGRPSLPGALLCGPRVPSPHLGIRLLLHSGPDGRGPGDVCISLLPLGSQFCVTVTRYKLFLPAPN